jgi:ESCRT-I complex subunit TSG101
MRQVNKLCKEQFIARAEILVVSRMQQERGVTNGFAPRDDGAESPRDVGFGFLRPRPPQPSPPPPPRETRKPPPSWNSNSNSHPSGWWD